MTFYDKTGKAIAYNEDNETIYLFSGQPVAYFFENTIYGFNGKHLGWFENNWIRDLQGRCVFFNEHTKGGGPMIPMKHIKPMKSMKSMKSMKAMKVMRSMKSTNSISWSNLSGILFFNNNI